MNLKFQGNLFGLSGSFDIGTDNTCAPKYNSDGEWTWNAKLGECGMRISDYSNKGEE